MQKPLLGYVIAAAIGAAVSIVIGYLVYAAPGDAVGFGYWLNRPMRYSVVGWAMGGILAGLGLRYITAR